MSVVLQPWYLLSALLAGWVNREQQEAIEYLRAENLVLREKLPVHARYDPPLAPQPRRRGPGARRRRAPARPPSGEEPSATDPNATIPPTGSDGPQTGPKRRSGKPPKAKPTCES